MLPGCWAALAFVFKFPWIVTSVLMSAVVRYLETMFILSVCSCKCYEAYPSLPFHLCINGMYLVEYEYEYVCFGTSYTRKPDLLPCYPDQFTTYTCMPWLAKSSVFLLYICAHNFGPTYLQSVSSLFRQSIGIVSLCLKEFISQTDKHSRRDTSVSICSLNIRLCPPNETFQPLWLH